MASKKVVKKETQIPINQEIKKEIKEKDKEKEIKQIKKNDSEDEDININNQVMTQTQQSDFDAYEFYKTYDPTKNKFNNVLSLYEFTSCLGLRATQISEGCPVLIDVPEGMENPEEIALLEIKAGKCPLIICREGREYWRVCDLINPHIE
jgi:DNA-directed RNA polymerase subunit K/omega